ncbi:UPF0175 family protein [Ravibacter arvi]
MAATIEISYPESLALSLKMGSKEFEKEIKTLSLVKLYELGKVSSGAAAGLLGLTRLEFLESLAEYRVSFLQPESDEDLVSDFSNA